MKGMIVYSFGWRQDGGHCPCNIRLAKAVKRIIDTQKEPILVFAQRTTASVLKEIGVECYIVQKREGYEGSEEPTWQATEIFKKDGIREVIPVAQPFIHLIKCIFLVRKQGFKTMSFWKLARMIGWVGFDRFSVQPATRDPFRLIFCTARQMLCGYRPPPEQSEP